jgi:hypothetical protein
MEMEYMTIALRKQLAQERRRIFFQIVLILITLISLGWAIQAQREVRQARAVVDAALAGEPSSESAVQGVDVPPVAPAGAGTVETARIRMLQQQVAMLQAECDKLKRERDQRQATCATNAVPR